MVYNNTLQYGDLDRTGGRNLVDDLDLETAVQISILTERRVEPGDEYFDIVGYKGGWWGDVAGGSNDQTGSRLWLLRREKTTESNLNQARIYIEECLQWLLDDGVATEIVVTTKRGVTPADLRFGITIQRPADTGIWARTWDIQLNAL